MTIMKKLEVDNWYKFKYLLWLKHLGNDLFFTILIFKVHNYEYNFASYIVFRCLAFHTLPPDNVHYSSLTSNANE